MTGTEKAKAGCNLVRDASLATDEQMVGATIRVNTLDRGNWRALG